MYNSKLAIPGGDILAPSHQTQLSFSIPLPADHIELHISRGAHIKLVHGQKGPHCVIANQSSPSTCWLGWGLNKIHESINSLCSVHLVLALRSGQYNQLMTLFSPSNQLEQPELIVGCEFDPFSIDVDMDIYGLPLSSLQVHNWWNTLKLNRSFGIRDVVIIICLYLSQII